MVVWRWITLILVGLFLLGAFVAPLMLIFWRGLVPLAPQSVALIIDVVSATLWQAVVSATLAACVALSVTWTIMRRPGWLANAAWLAVIVPFIVPTPVAATMATAACASDSWCADLLGLEVPQGFALIIAVHVWFNTGVLVRLLSDAWLHAEQRMYQAAATLGASPWRQFCTITWPVLTPALGTGFVLVLLYCIGSFGVILLLGGGRVISLEVEIWRQTAQFLRLDIATALAVVQLSMSLGLLFIAERWQKRLITERTMVRAPQQVGIGSTLALCLQIATLSFFVAPFAYLVARSVLTTDTWWQAFGALNVPVRGSGIFLTPLDTLWRSLWIASIVAIVTLVVAWTISAPGWWRVFATLPIGVSAVTLGLGYLLWFGPLRLLQSPFVLLMAHVVLALPLVGRQLMLARDQLSPAYQAAAATLGSGPWRQFWSVTMPLIRRSFVIATLIGFTISLGDFAAGLLLTQPDTATAPIMIGRLLGRPGALQYAMAAALSCCLVVVCVGVMLIVQRLERPVHVRVADNR